VSLFKTTATNNLTTRKDLFFKVLLFATSSFQHIFSSKQTETNQPQTYTRTPFVDLYERIGGCMNIYLCKPFYLTFIMLWTLYFYFENHTKQGLIGISTLVIIHCVSVVHSI